VFATGESSDFSTAERFTKFFHEELPVANVHRVVRWQMFGGKGESHETILLVKLGLVQTAESPLAGAF